MHNERILITSEIRELEALLADIPAERVIDRMSLQSRLTAAKAALERLPATGKAAQRIRLTFRGKPVLGSYGINADFAAKAASAFSDAYSAVTAALKEGLSHMGPIPDKDKNQLLITGTAIGSFGFEFELPSQSEPQENLFDDDEETPEAMEKLTSLLRLSAEGSDDDVAAIVEEVHPRAVKKVHEFLDLLVQQHAWCALELNDLAFHFVDHEQIKWSSERLKADNIREDKTTLVGEFQGILPAQRTFEFCLSANKNIIRGKIDKTIADPGILNREWLHKKIRVQLKTTRVGAGKTRYVLSSLNDVTAENPS
ncbi:MAG: hypothetical protein Q4D61_01455 [Cardiobacteriaceae bacterium]|nr:hypothetical protein [Cardiobacteriaceae bacterium]